GEDVGDAVDVEGDEGADGGAGFDGIMVTVIDFDAGAAVRAVEGEGDGAELGGEFLVGESGDDDLAVDVGEVGEGLGALIAGGDNVGECGLGEFGIGEFELGEFSRGIDADENGGGVGPAATGNGEESAAGGGVDGEVVDEDVGGSGAEHGGDLLVEV